MSTEPRRRKVPSKAAIVRAVASSTAIETGQRIKDIEVRLRRRKRSFPHLSLAH